MLQEVIDKYTAVVKLTNSGDKLKLDQTHLETVIPAPGKFFWQDRSCLCTCRSTENLKSGWLVRTCLFFDNFWPVFRLFGVTFRTVFGPKSSPKSVCKGPNKRCGLGSFFKPFSGWFWALFQAVLDHFPGQKMVQKTA